MYIFWIFLETWKHSICIKTHSGTCFSSKCFISTWQCAYEVWVESSQRIIPANYLSGQSPPILDQIECVSISVQKHALINLPPWDSLSKSLVFAKSFYRMTKATRGTWTTACEISQLFLGYAWKSDTMMISCHPMSSRKTTSIKNTCTCSSIWMPQCSWSSYGLACSFIGASFMHQSQLFVALFELSADMCCRSILQLMNFSAKYNCFALNETHFFKLTFCFEIAWMKV